MRVRIVKSENCKLCQIYIASLKKQNFDFDIYDGDAEENQKQLDEWKVFEFPVVQIVDGDAILYQFPHGNFKIKSIMHKMSQLQKGKK